MTTRNVYGVNKRQWRKWTSAERAVFNETRRCVCDLWRGIFPDGMADVKAPARRIAAWECCMDSGGCDAEL